MGARAFSARSSSVTGPVVGEPVGGVRGVGGLSINWGFDLGGANGPITPVTLLSGFLGAGKTTLLQKVLSNRRGLRIGVVVNDVAAVNVDARLVTSTTNTGGATGIEVAELQNGCVCCSLADDLFTSVTELLARAAAAGKPFDHVVVELSGVSEPQAVRDNWRMAKEMGHPAALSSDISRVVTVVDSSAFSADWFDGRLAVQRNSDAQAEDSNRSIADLMAQQIETADMVLLNKADLVNDSELSSVEAVVRALSPGSDVFSAAYADADLLKVLPHASPDSERTACSAAAAGAEGDRDGPDAAGRTSCSHGHGDSGHGHGHGHGHGDHHSHSHGTSPQEKYGIHSFVFRARRPFASQRFMQLASDMGQGIGSTAVEALAGLLRAKGVCWVDSDPLREYAWSFAGSNCTLTRGEPWWAATTAEQQRWRAAYPGMQEVFDRIRRECWDPDEAGWGDRRQELVFIGGPGMDEGELQERLRDCLLDDDEMGAFSEAHATRLAGAR